MTDSTKDIWNEEDEETERPPKRNRERKFFLFFLILAGVLAVVLAAAWRDGTGLDVLHRYFTYGSSGSADTAGYTYDASSSNRFAVLGDRLVVLSNTSLSLLAADGSTVWSTPVKMSAPALAEGGNRVAAYDVGGRELYVLDKNGEQYSLTADKEEPYISATLNQSGMLAVTAEKKSYKGAVSVYDAGGTLAFTFNSSERFVTDACVTDDGKRLAVVTLGQTDGTFISDLVFYDLTKTDPLANCPISGGLSLAVGQLEERLAVVCDNSLAFISQSGKLEAAYDYAGGYLREYDLHGDGFAVLLLNRYKSGSAGRLVTVNSEGKETASLDVQDEILSITAQGKYIAVLYADRLVIYNTQLEEYASLSGTDYAREALIRSDGSAVVAAGGHAALFLP